MRWELKDASPFKRKSKSSKRATPGASLKES